jgi:hypothetical protein
VDRARAIELVVEVAGELLDVVGPAPIGELEGIATA